MSTHHIKIADNHISAGALELLKTALHPEVLGKESDRFDVGVEFSKAQLREQINTIVGKPVL